MRQIEIVGIIPRLTLTSSVVPSAYILTAVSLNGKWQYPVDIVTELYQSPCTQTGKHPEVSGIRWGRMF